MKRTKILITILAAIASVAGIALLIHCALAMPFTKPVYPWLVLAGMVLTPLWPLVHYWRATDVLLRWKHQK